ncbi:MAG: enolase C-terminal domain-like protein [Gemmataceae bacterium]
MRIVELAVHQVRIPLKKAIKHASHSRTETDNLVVRCALSNGNVGYGEGVPRDYVTGETVDSSIDVLKRSDLSAQLTPCSDYAQAIAVAERLTVSAGDERGIAGNAARCAVELAFLDAYGRAFGENLIAVTRALASDLFELKESVRYSTVLTSAKGLKLWLAATAYAWYGFQQYKVKVGIPGYDDVKRLRTVRNRTGAKADLRIDANEAWTLDEAAERIAELEPFGISSVEQPLPYELSGELSKLRKRIKTPVMLDESLCGMVDAKRAVREGWCDLFNIRLSKCGGLIPSLKLAQFAVRHGLGFQLGCQVGETAILSAAGRMFASSVKGIRFLEGSYDRHLVRESLGMEDITFGRGGVAPMLAGCGVGVLIDDAKLQALTVKREVLFG